MNSVNKLKPILKLPLFWIIALGFSLRFYAAGMRTIINPDGAQYIFQASAIFSGHLSDVFACKLNYLSPLPLFIAAAFSLCRDWIVAGQAVDVLFGTATLLPLYYLLKRFARPPLSWLTLLIYALIPVFVDGSGDVLRGPLFWFFSVLGMLMFIRQFDEDAPAYRFRLDLILSALCFFVATWDRIEGIMFLMVSPVWLLMGSAHKKRMQRFFIFLAPFVILGLMTAAAVHLSRNEVLSTMRIKNVVDETTRFASDFAALKPLITKAYAQEENTYGEFLRCVREVLFLIPALTILHNILEGVFYPFALIYFFGFFGLRQKRREDKRIGYFLWLSLAAFVLLYIHIMRNWIFADRFLSILIFPGAIIMTNGIEKVVYALMRWRRWPLAKAAAVMTACLLVIGLPKSLKPNETDKVFYRQAAAVVADRKQPEESLPLYAMRPSRAFEWVLLYSHRRDAALNCSTSLIIDIPADYDAFRRELDGANACYFLYEKRYWPKNGFDLSALTVKKDFRILGSWQHPDSGQLTLFERIHPSTDLESSSTADQK